MYICFFLYIIFGSGIKIYAIWVNITFSEESAAVLLFVGCIYLVYIFKKGKHSYIPSDFIGYVYRFATCVIRGLGLYHRKTPQIFSIFLI